MYKIAIVEDTEMYQKTLLGFIKNYEKNNDYKFNIKVFNDGLDIIDNISFGFDIIFMDIIMQDLDGMKAANIIRKQDRNVIIIFISSVIEYAVQGYSVGALNYILKPISEYDFSQQLTKALDRLDSNNSFQITVNNNGEIFRLNILDISYIESIGHYVHFHTVDGIFTSRNSLKNLEPKLKPYHFVRCNSCYLINLKYVENITNETVTVCGNRLKMSRSKKSYVRDCVLQYGGELMV